MPPILAHVEAEPTAVLLISVGYISDVYINTIVKQHVAPNLPIIDNVVCMKKRLFEFQMVKMVHTTVESQNSSLFANLSQKWFINTYR